MYESAIKYNNKDGLKTECEVKMHFFKVPMQNWGTFRLTCEPNMCLLTVPNTTALVYFMGNPAANPNILFW